MEGLRTTFALPTLYLTDYGKIMIINNMKTLSTDQKERCNAILDQQNAIIDVSLVEII